MVESDKLVKQNVQRSNNSECILKTSTTSAHKLARRRRRSSAESRMEDSCRPSSTAAHNGAVIMAVALEGYKCPRHYLKKSCG